jgi:hypothetical protein
MTVGRPRKLATPITGTPEPPVHAPSWPDRCRSHPEQNFHWKTLSNAKTALNSIALVYNDEHEQLMVFIVELRTQLHSDPV